MIFQQGHIDTTQFNIVYNQTESLIHKMSTNLRNFKGLTLLQIINLHDKSHLEETM